MLSFLQDELIGLRSRWPRLLALLTCLGLALVVLEQQRAIETQGTLIAALSGDANKANLRREKPPKVSVYITDSKILEPASKPPDHEAIKAPSAVRFQHQI
jgi:hypothetical protein